MSRQPASSYQNNRAETYALYRRRDHANIEAMQNLMLDEIRQRTRCEEYPTGIDCPPRVRAFISALQSAHGGGRVINEPFQRKHLTVAAYLQFSGSVEAREARVRRLINSLEAYQNSTGYRLFHITRGGAPTGEVTRAGDLVYSATEYVDLLKPIADDAVQRARASEQWRGSETVKAHPGRALAAQAAWAVDQLPRIDMPRGDDTPPSTPSPMPLDKYEQQQEARLAESIEKVADQIELRGGDSSEWIDRLLVSLERMRSSRLKTFRARTDFASISAVEPEPETGEVDGDGTAYMANTFEEPVETAGATEVLPLTSVTSSQINDLKTEDAPDMLAAALEWARKGYAVFPMHTPRESGCSCQAGPQCKSSGKHARVKEWEKFATTDASQITLWWRRWPDANIGIATGGPMSACVVLDIDPASGGGAGFAELIEQVELPETMTVETGGGGEHLFFAYEGEDVRNSAKKLGDGLDVRGHGGCVVAAPSLHASGRRYHVANAVRPAPLPPALRELMLATPTPQQAANARLSARAGQGIGSASFAEGERNSGLFRVGCAIWGNGKAQDVTDLHHQLLECNALRCVPPLGDAEVAQLTANISSRYQKGIPISEDEQRALC